MKSNRAQIAALAEALCAETPVREEVSAAPTGKKFRCKICGWEYEGETLPADLICPLCKRPSSDFEPVE